MLRGVSIRDMLIIDQLDLDFQPGLNVLTGETGAGKSILLDCLGFVLGWRGRAELVRQGADQGEVTAWFDIAPDHPVRPVLEDAGFECDDELILRRINTRDGRKTAFVNDRRASGQVLRAIGEQLLELHGQHDDRGLLNVKAHRALLDEFAQNERLIEACRAAWRSMTAAGKAVDDRRSAIAAVAEEEDFLRHAVAELTKFGPEAGEENTLDARRRMMQAAEKIRDDVAKAHQALGFDGAEGMVSNASRWIENAAAQVDGALDGPLTTIGDALNAIGDAQAQVEQFLDSLSFDAHDLETTEERLFALRALARKHGVAADDLPALTDALAAKLETLDQGTAGLADLEKAHRAAQAAFDQAAADLTANRVSAGAALDQAMGRELAPLKMERAVFRTTITAGTPGSSGVDDVAFTVATNPGAPAGPLNKIASGGELSRFLLALKVCLTGQDTHRTMIFDEIDRGVGGATADAVGRRLKALGQGGQVLVVTHSPQVAALGATHWRVEKHTLGDVTTSTVVPLTDPMRVDEVARMISGDTITDAARAAAQELLSAV